MSKMSPEKAQAYWKENITMILKLLVVWFVVSFGCGILFINQLNTIEISGVKLGFWFAQQGAIYCFVVLIFVYVSAMGKIDEKYGVHE
jgi:putative solute:sodium symporter small subunit